MNHLNARLAILERRVGVLWFLFTAALGFAIVVGVGVAVLYVGMRT